VRQAASTRQARRAAGVFYTPPPIVDYIIAQTLGPLLAGTPPADAARLRILDPACGAGVFLLAAYRYLLAWYQTYAAAPLTLQDRWAILHSQLYGVDIDPAAVLATRAALARAACEGVGDPPGDAPSDLAATIRCGDALLGPDFAGVGAGAGPRAFDWGAAFPLVGQAGGFDAVIGNPPWISLKGKFGQAVYSAPERAYLARVYSGDTYRPNIYEYFIKRAVALTRVGGYQAFIVPDGVGRNRQFAPLRRELLQTGAFRVLLYQARFPGVIADTLIYVYRPGVPGDAAPVEVGEFAGSRRHVAPATFLRLPDAQFLRVPPLIHKLYAGLPNTAPLGSVVTTGVGFIAQAGAVTPTAVAPAQQPVLKGRHIGRFRTLGESYCALTPGTLAGGTQDPRKLGAVPKILLRKTGLPLAATLDASGRYPEQSLYFLCAPTAGLDLAYILGILNSRLFQYVYATWLVTNRGSTPQLKKIHLDQFPIRTIDFAAPQEAAQHATLVRLVRQMLAAHRRLARADAVTAARLRQRIAALDARIDGLVYILYALTPEEIALVAASTAATNGL
jgi:hypothetical protein